MNNNKKHLQDFETIKNLDLVEYFNKNGLNEIIGVEKFTKPKSIGPNDTYNQEGGEVFLPDCGDLSRLHAIVQIRKCLTVLELGSGVSTRVLAHSLKLNHNNFKDKIELVRRQNPFKLFSVDAEEEYAQITENSLGDLGKYVEMHVIPGIQSTFGSYACGRYQKMPSVCPDLIYIDGPSPYSYIHDKKEYINISHPDITNITSDLLILEPYLLPGTFVIFDGMTNNARFNRRNLKRNWVAFEDTEGDYTMMVLDEEPLGIHHKNQIAFINE